MARNSLLVGLLILIAVTAGPAFAVLLDLQFQIRHERERLARTVALQQAELIDSAIGRVVDSVHAVLLNAGQTDAISGLDPRCGGRLTRLRAQLPGYRLLALLRPDGEVVCAAGDDSLIAAPLQAALETARRVPGGVAGFTVGNYVAGADGVAMLPFILPVAGGHALLVAGLDPGRLDAALATAPQRSDAHTVIRDRDGRVVARRPATLAEPGEMRPGPPPELLGASLAGTALIRDEQGRERVLGVVPAANGSHGLSVATTFDVADLNSRLDRLARRGTLLIVLGTACSVLLALLFGQRYLRAPAAALLGAARQWGAGQLGARAHPPAGAAAELTQLASAFNEMAGVLQAQRTELQTLNDALELRVADRTRALLESNNRLQVEIAEREMTEAHLRQAQKLQAVGQLAGGMAHDFNNLLTVILGSLDLLRRRLAGSDPRLERPLDTAAQAISRGSHLTAQLLAFSRKQPLLAVSVDVAATLENLTGLLSSTLGAAVRIQLRVAEGLWPALLDQNQFETAILNLALNARDAMARGGRLTIVAANAPIPPGEEPPELAPGDYVRVAVSDTGCGMSAEVLSRAIEPFFSTKPPGKGSGLGLSQVHGMVHQSGGRLTVESRVDEGTWVTMLLPRATTPPLPRALSEEQALAALSPEQVVLLVDDDEQVREVTALTLTECGYTVLTAEDGEAGLAVLEREHGRIALVIADHAMPGMNGREMLSVAAARWPHLRQLLATGYAELAGLAGDGLTMEQIVRKPFRVGELLARIHMVCQRPAVPAPEPSQAKQGEA